MKTASLLFLIIVLGSCSTPGEQSNDGNKFYVSNRAPLVEEPYAELPIGAIKPMGWLLEQLERQREGLTGNLDAIYPQVVGETNGWLGGDGDGWERGPYWLDGLVPLAYILDDDTLKAKVQKWVEWSITNQREDGYFGPIPFESPPEETRGVQKSPRLDWWPKMVMLKVLKQYYMATGDERIIDLMTGYFRYQLAHLPEQPLGHWSFWGNRRGADNLAMVYWLYNRTGDDFLLELGDLIHSQTYDWAGVFTSGKFRQLNPLPEQHTVNIAMGLKAPVIYYQRDHDPGQIKAVKDGLADLREVHGFVTGLYGADENLHGNSPTQGTEFCTVVEMMYSFEHMSRITGDPWFADYLEKIAYNALPTQHNDTFTARQYFQQANQVELSHEVRNFFNDANAQLCYGVLTGYPCCTTNMHQGWPKLVQNLWYATRDNGLAAMIYSSSEVTAWVGDGTGTEITVVEKTDYPFGETVRFTVQVPHEVAFPFELRIPGWAEEATIRVNGEVMEQVEGGGRMVTIDRSWSDGDEIELRLPMEVRVSRWAERSAGVERGPLVYALKIGERWEERPPDPDNWRIENPYYEVYPTAPWNYGLTEKGIDSVDFKVIRKETGGRYPWTLDQVPVELKTPGRRIPGWNLYQHSAGPLPVSGQYRYGQGSPAGDAPVEEITLVPYGATTLRIAQFPVVE